MAMNRTDNDKVIGIILIVVGILIALDFLSLGPVVTIAAIVAIILGVLVLAGQFRGSQAFGIGLIVAGVLVLVVPYLHFGLTFVINIVVGIVVVVAGVMKLDHKW